MRVGDGSHNPAMANGPVRLGTGRGGRGGAVEGVPATGMPASQDGDVGQALEPAGANPRPLRRKTRQPSPKRPQQDRQRAANQGATVEV